MPVPRSQSSVPRTKPVPLSSIWNDVPVTPAINQAWQAMGFKGPMPHIISTPLSPGLAGIAPFPRIPETSQIIISPKVAAGLQTLGLTKNRDLGALKVLLHEFAHTRQPMTLNRPTFEGGAEAYAATHLTKAMQRLGIDISDPTNHWAGEAYPGFTTDMFKKGWSALNRTQFGRR